MHGRAKEECRDENHYSFVPITYPAVTLQIRPQLAPEATNDTRCRWEKINTFLRFKFKTPNQHSKNCQTPKRPHTKKASGYSRLWPIEERKCMFVNLAESGLACVMCLFGDV